MPWFLLHYLEIAALCKDAAESGDAAVIIRNEHVTNRSAEFRGE
jgi:hypothetical protein